MYGLFTDLKNIFIFTKMFSQYISFWGILELYVASAKSNIMAGDQSEIVGTNIHLIDYRFQVL